MNLLTEALMLMMIFFLGNESNLSEVHLGRMLQILREFSTDPILSIYVIDDVWEYMKAMKVYCYCYWNHIGSWVSGEGGRIHPAQL